MQSKKHKQAKRPETKQWLPAAIVAVIVLVALVWCSGNLVYAKVAVGDRLLPASTSDAKLKKSLRDSLAAYRLSITYPDRTVKFFALSTIGITVDDNKTLAEVRARQNNFWHRLQWWQPTRVTLVSQVNQETLQKFVAQQAHIITKPAQNAKLAIVDGTAKVNGGDAGKVFTLPNAAQTIITAASSLRSSSLQLQPSPLPPTVTPDSLAGAKAKVEAILKQQISLTIGGQTATPSASDIAAWLVIQPDTNEITVDTGKIADYLHGISGAHSSAPKSQVVDTNGSVLQAGQQGIIAPDTDGAANQISQELLGAKGITLAIHAEVTPFKTVTAPTSGKWIEVDVTNKRMYAYSNNSLVRDFLVTAGAPGTPTVIGRFAIYAKYQSQDMFGENRDGSSYFQPNVPYVNYFYADYAIHGNYWRPSSYFGLINSSHGCVGIPVSDSEWVYDWAPIGTPVVVHT